MNVTRTHVGSNIDSKSEEAETRVRNTEVCEYEKRFDENRHGSLAWERLRQVVHVIDHGDEQVEK